MADFDYLFENTFQTCVMITISYRYIFSVSLSLSLCLDSVSFFQSLCNAKWTFVLIRSHMLMLAQSAVWTSVFKGAVHSKRKSLSSFSHTCIVPHPCNWLTSVKRKRMLLLFSLQRNCRCSKKLYQKNSLYNLFSTDERKSYEFWKTWEQINGNWNNFCVNCP